MQPTYSNGNGVTHGIVEVGRVADRTKGKDGGRLGSKKMQWCRQISRILTLPQVSVPISYNTYVPRGCNFREAETGCQIAAALGLVVSPHRCRIRHCPLLRTAPVRGIVGRTISKNVQRYDLCGTFANSIVGKY